MSKNRKLVAPDGGWGWMILFVYVFNGMLIVLVEQNFGLLIKDKFELLNMSGTEIASIVSTNMAVGELLGLWTGPLLKRFGIRIIAMVGSISFSIGFTTIAFAKSYIQFMMCYGILTGLGMGTIKLTIKLSVNLYFSKKRRKVVGAGLAIRSIGFILFPHFVIFLLSYYGISSAILLIGGIFSHTVCTSLLLRPVEWYMIAVESTISEQDAELPLYKEKGTEGAKLNRLQTILKKLIQYCDLTLFTNRAFLSITCGVTLSTFANKCFSNLLPFILTDLGFQSAEIAAFLSVSFTSSIITRFACPFVADYFKRSSRFMYGFGCLMMIIGRFVIIYLYKTTKSVAIPILWGIADAVNIVHQQVIFADNIPPERLSSAESIYMALCGITIFAVGPLIGLIKDGTGTYVSSVYTINSISCITLVLWLVDYMCSSFKQRGWNMV